MIESSFCRPSPLSAALPNAFELFKVDFLIDASEDAWLLELNAYPDFGKTGEKLKDVVVGKLFEAVVNVAVKGFFDADAVKEVSGLDLVADIDLGRRGSMIEAYDCTSRSLCYKIDFCRVYCLFFILE